VGKNYWRREGLVEETVYKIIMNVGVENRGTGIAQSI
jgi:hypothetical protein